MTDGNVRTPPESPLCKGGGSRAAMTTTQRERWRVAWFTLA